MGGKAFLAPPNSLHTPRLPRTLYTSLLPVYHALLSPLYTHIATPPATPAKTFHGDVDILVASPELRALTPVRVAEALGAKCWVSNGEVTSFAVRWPEGEEEEVEGEMVDGVEGGREIELARANVIMECYVQVDVHVCRDGGLWEWECFHQAYGDLWNILGTTIRGFGLSANDTGLYIRIKEIEKLDRKKSLVFLTRDRGAVLGFLGLDEGLFLRGFETLEEMFLWVVGGRFFERRAFVWGEGGEVPGKEKKRLRERETYREFVQDWLPKWDGVRNTESVTREEVCDEALESFAKRVDFEEKVRAWRVQREALIAKQRLHEGRRRKAVAEAEYADAWIKQVKKGR